MDVRDEEIRDLLEFFSKNTYNAWDTHPKVQNVMQRCLDLFALDYTYSVVSNSNGELSTNYPSSLVVLEADKHLASENGEATETNGISPSLSASLSATTNGHAIHDTTASASNSSMTASSLDGFNVVQELPKIKDLCSKARYARCRARFPVPVILYNNKHICRSATLSGGPEIYGRASFDYFFSGGSTTESKPEEAEAAVPEDIVPDAEGQGQGDWQLFDRVRNQDIRLLKAFQVQTIVDLMVEKKKVKFGVYVTSSEKVDKKDRYRDFTLISLPYPGCEFFKQYRDNGYNAEKLMFEWNQGHVDANIFVPPDVSTDALNLEWSQYRKWDLIRLTQNYLKLLLAYLKGDHRGMLIHCISGWDRTPLFVSLLRLSLWADGAVHKSLNAEQILYLTLAYDWLLFGHNLEDRLNKGEEILFFCFYFLSHIVDREYSVAPEEDFSSEDLNGSEVPTAETQNDIPADVTPNGNHEELVNGDDVAKGSEDVTGDVVASVLKSNGYDVACRSDVNGDNKECANGDLDASTVDRPSDGLSHSIVSSDTCESSLPDARSLTSQSVQSQPNSNQNLPLQNGTESSGSVSDEKNHVNESAETVPAVESSESVPSTTNGESPPEATVTGVQDENELRTIVVNGTEAVAPAHPSSDTQTENLVPNTELPVTTKHVTVSSNPESTSNDPLTPANGTSEDLLEQPYVDPSVKKTRRYERLQLVRKRFYQLYGSAIGFQQRHNISDSNSGSGLSVIIDNIATKVGIRVANRSTS